MEIEDILKAQRAFFASGATRSAQFRLDALQRLRDAIKKREDALCDAMWQDLHKSPSESYLAEIGFVLDEIRHHARYLRSWMRGSRVPTPWTLMPATSRIVPEPLGVALLVAPWNYPVQLLLCPLVGAISAGNCAVLKSSPLVPRTEALLRELVADAFDPAHVAFVYGGAEVVGELLCKRYDYIFFTGGSAFGQTVMAAAAEHLTPVTLELGGKSPCIVDRDADIPLAARRIMWGKLLNAGQTCIAPDYLLVHASVKEQLVRELEDAVRRFYGDDPAQSPDYPRIVTVQAAARLDTMMHSSGRILWGGRSDVDARYVAPTLIDDPDDDSPLMRQEIFGPLLPLKTFCDLSEAEQYVNAREKPLALYYFGPRSGADRVLGRISSGGVCINDTIVHIANHRLPFGGVGHSGIGKYHGRLSFELFSNLRAVVRASTFVDVPLKYPPYRRPALFRKLFG